MITIVDILGSIDDKIENNEKIIERLEKIFRLYYKKLSAKSNKKTSLKALIDTIIGGDWGKDEPIRTYEYKVICVRGADIINMKTGSINGAPIRYIQKKSYISKQIMPNDIIIEISGGSPSQSTGRAAIVTKKLLGLYDTPIICTNFCRIIRCNNKQYAPYLYAALCDMYNSNVFFNFENGTTGIKNLDIQSIVNNEEICLPTLIDLNSFCNSFNKIQDYILELRHQNTKLEDLKQLYLKKFF